MEIISVSFSYENTITTLRFTRILRGRKNVSEIRSDESEKSNKFKRFPIVLYVFNSEWIFFYEGVINKNIIFEIKN